MIMEVSLRNTLASLALISIIIGGRGFAQSSDSSNIASFHSGLLSLPALRIGTDYYSLTLSINSTESLELTLADISE